MCTGCKLKANESVEILENANTDFKAYIENTGNGYRLHFTNNIHHTVRDIYFCPFCGEELS